MRTDDAGNPRWLLLALAAIAAHQLQSFAAEPRERPFRVGVLAVEAAIAASSRLPDGVRRWRGAAWALLAVPPLGGAVAGHLLPIARGRPAPPASETAPLNLAGAALLLALGLAQLRERGPDGDAGIGAGDGGR